jgi:hypothetical protein
MSPLATHTGILLKPEALFSPLLFSSVRADMIFCRIDRWYGIGAYLEEVSISNGPIFIT